MIAGFEIIEKEIRDKITDELDKVGLLYRIFSRAKDDQSIAEKIKRKSQEGNPYIQNERLIQDIIGIRIVTYFTDDIELVKEVLCQKITFVSEEVDRPKPTVFMPKRTNYICSFSDLQKSVFAEVQKSSNNPHHSLLDATYELQLRTILSEGWHEIDHNLRYKCKSDWENHKENDRLLNGIYASLETNDFALKNLFSELSYKHFKNGNWEGLVRNKFRLKFQQVPVRKDLLKILDENNEIGKDIYKLDRLETLLTISRLEMSLPVNINNLVFLINVISMRNQEILDVTPSVILDIGS